LQQTHVGLKRWTSSWELNTTKSTSIDSSATPTTMTPILTATKALLRMKRWFESRTWRRVGEHSDSWIKLRRCKRGRGSGPTSAPGRWASGGFRGR
jgi:hypothetical protein